MLLEITELFYSQYYKRQPADHFTGMGTSSRSHMPVLYFLLNIPPCVEVSFFLIRRSPLMDWKSLFLPDVPLFEIILRGSVLYITLFVLLRVVL